MGVSERPCVRHHSRHRDGGVGRQSGLTHLHIHVHPHVVLGDIHVQTHRHTNTHAATHTHNHCKLIAHINYLHK